MLPPLHVGQIGLLFDILGVVILARGLFFNNIESISLQGGGYINYNPHLILALCEQKLDAFFGLPLLCVGFAFQFWATVDNSEAMFWTGFGGIIMLVVVISYFAMRPILADRMRDKVIALRTSK